MISWPEMQARATGAIKTPVGDDPKRVVRIPHGYGCVFSMHMQKWIKCRHLSVSVETPGKWPNEMAVHELAKLFGFKDGMKGQNVTFYLEKESEAVNVVEAFA